MNKIAKIKIKIEPDEIEGGDAYGVTAEAEIHVPMQQNHSVIQWIHSGGLWGLDYDEAKLMADDQLDYLQQVLRKLNCDMDSFPVLARQALAKM